MVMVMGNLRVVFFGDGRKAQSPSNPRYPNGMDIDVSGGKLPRCSVDLPYPAKEVGRFLVSCRICGSQSVVTAAGRPDDPRSVKIPCLPPASDNEIGHA
jgi:hypothetical protein